MLNKSINRDSIIMITFILMLVLVSIYLFVDRSIIDVIYVGVIIYYFCRFLFIKCRR